MAFYLTSLISAHYLNNTNRESDKMKLSTLCYLEKDNCYLLLHRTKRENDENKDKWIGIGGKFEENESPDECIRREVKEETGLELKSYKFCGIVTFVSEKWQTEYMHLFKSSDFVGKITECNEGVLEWIDKSKIKNLPIWEGDKIFLELLNSDHPFFSLKLMYDKNDTLISAFLDGKQLL